MDSVFTITFSLGLVCAVLIQCSQAGNFVVSPSNITKPVGSVAEFRCKHQSLDATISWLFNGSSATRFPNVTRMDSGGVSTLTIPSVPGYNGTEVVCEAFIRDGGTPVFEQTPPAILTVIAAMEPTNTTNYPTVPSPPVLIVTMEQRHVYMCNHSETINIFWRVNGSRLNVEIFPIEIDASILQLPGGRVYSLEIGGRLEHNATTIQCSARLSDGSVVTTPSVLFLMQGLLQNVVNLKRRNDTIVWGAPFSLDLTNVEPDIVYCVDVCNITCGRGHRLISDCDVMETSHTSDILQPGYIYEYTIIPRSNVEGAQNGTSKTITERFTDLQLSTRGYTFSFRDNIELQVRIHLNLESQEQQQLVNLVDAASYSLSLVPLDGFEEESLLMSTITVRNGSSVMLTVSLPYKRIWNYTVLANDCEEHSLLETNELSTHDIQNISVTSPQPGEVRVTGDFIDGSTATGLLTIVISTSEIFYHLIERGSGQLHIEGSIQGVVGGEHSISFFVVEESGLPFNRTASTPKVVSIINSNDVNQPSIEYSLQSTSTGVCITCTFLDSSTTDCVAVVHQRISQLNFSGLMNIESSHKLTRSGDTASGCIEGVNMEDYQVGVVGGKQLSPPVTETKDRSSSIEGVIVGIVLGVLVFILSAVVVVVSLIVIRKKRTKSPLHDIEARGPPPPMSDYVNQPESEATVINVESIPVPNRQSPSDPTYAEPQLPGKPPVQTSYNEGQALHSPPPVPTRTEDREEGSSDVETSSPLMSADRTQGYFQVPTTAHQLSTSRPPVSPLRTNGDPNVGAYAEIMAFKCSTASPPTDIDKVVYQEVQGLHNAQGPLYAFISYLPINAKMVPDDLHKTCVLYSEIKHQVPFSCSAAEVPNDDYHLGDPGPLYDLPQLPGSTVVPPPTDIQDRSNKQESPPPVPPRTKDSEVLIQESTTPSPDHEDTASTDTQSPSDLTYAGSKEKQKVSLSESSVAVTSAQPAATEPVVYEDIKGFKNSEGQHYAMLGELFTSKKACTPDDSDQEKTVYSEIQPGSRGPTTAAVCVEPDTSSEKNIPPTGTDPPFTVEYIFPHLLSLASKWEDVGEALSLDEDCLDEISTNNETDEACLHVMLEFYMKRSDLKHSWEEIREAMRKVGEDQTMDATFTPGEQSVEHGSQYTPCFDQTQEKNENTDLNEGNFGQ